MSVLLLAFLLLLGPLLTSSVLGCLNITWKNFEFGITLHVRLNLPKSTAKVKKKQKGPTGGDTCLQSIPASILYFVYVDTSLT